MQTIPQIGIGCLCHARAGGGLFLFHCGLCGQTLVDVLFHPFEPTFGVGKHLIGFKDLELFFVAALGPIQKLLDTDAKLFDGGVQAGFFLIWVIGNRVCDYNARLMQPDLTFGRAFLDRGAGEHSRALV